MTLAIELVAQVRRDLQALVRDEVTVREQLAVLRAAASPDREAGRALAFSVASAHVELRSLGELASRTERERDHLLRLATDDEVSRTAVTTLVAHVSVPEVFDALAHALPFSFRVEPSERLRAHVRALEEALNAPLWPGVPVGIERLYVVPEIRIVDDEKLPPSIENVSPPAGVEDAMTLLRDLLRSGASISLVGSSGVGKSTLAEMIAGRFAADWSYIPVLVHAGEWNAPRATGGGDERATESAPDPRRAPLDDLGRTGPVLFVVDGLDDVTDWERSALLRKLGALLRQTPERRAVFLGREALSTAEQSVLVAEGRRHCVVALMPFDDARVRAWAERWRLATGRSFDLERIEKLSRSTDGERDPDLLALLRYPLVLALLATAEPASGRRPAYRGAGGRFALLERVLDGAATAVGAPGDAARYRELLRAVAMECARVRGGADIERVLHGRRGAEGRPLSITRRASGAAQLRAFPLTWHDTDHGSVRFVHVAVRDHLVADHLATCVTSMLDAVCPNGEGYVVRASRERSLAAAWVEAFGQFAIGSSARAQLHAMLKAAAREPARASGKELEGPLQELLATLFQWLVEDHAAEETLGVARGIGARPRRVAACALYNLFALASCVGEGARWLDTDEIVSEGFAVAWHQITSEIELRARELDALTRAVSLRGFHARSLRCFASVTTDLRGVALDDAFLDGVVLRGVAFDRANLFNTSLRGASFVDVSFEGASMRWCLADGATFDRVNLRGAVLADASLDGATFFRCDMRGADLTGASLHGVTWRDVDLTGATLRGAEFDESARELLSAGVSGVSSTS